MCTDLLKVWNKICQWIENNMNQGKVKKFFIIIIQLYIVIILYEKNPI